MSKLICTLLTLAAGGNDPVVQVSVTLDSFHRAAATADGESYFGHFKDDAVFLGTDASERWSMDDLRAYSAPHFAAGKGWTYVASDRNVRVADSGQVAWFDERLQNGKYGEVRGSGVLELVTGEWKISQYNLSFPVPNDRAEALTKKVVKSEGVGDPRGEQFFAMDGERQLALWNKVVPQDEEAQAGPRPVVVLLPSSTFCARGTWDFPLRDYSVMNALAKRGFDVFAVDVGGYGLSSSPVDQPRGGARSASRDLLIALERIEELRGAKSVALVGPSWGSQVAALFATEHPERVRSLVLYGYNWRQRIPEEAIRGAFGEDILENATRPVTRQGAVGDFRPGTHEEDVPAAFTAHLMSQARSVPTGSLHDYMEELPLADPSKLTMPTLLLFGRMEFEYPNPAASGALIFRDDHWRDCLEFFSALPGHRHWVELPGGGHSAHLDRTRLLFQRCLAGWIERTR